MITTGHVSAVWTKQTLLELDFIHRTDYKSHIAFESPGDAKIYHQAIAVDHCSTPNLDKFFLKEKEFCWLKDKVYAVHKLGPGCILPFHKDSYPRYRANYDIKDLDSIQRIIVFLEDWKDGHLLQVDHHMYVHWRAGDFVTWRGETSHLAANLGSEDRYTLQITGTLGQ